MLALSLAVCLAPGAPVPPPKSRPTYDYATLTVEQAHELAGRTIRVKANITDPDPEYAGAHSPDDNRRRVVWRRGEATRDEGPLVVEGRLRLDYIPGYTINGERVEGFWTFRIVAARPIRDREDDD
jgi:hypothetical protein